MTTKMTQEGIDLAIGFVIQGFRRDACMSQAAVAEKCRENEGINWQAHEISRFETGKRALSIEYAIILGRAMGTTGSAIMHKVADQISAFGL